MSGKIAIVGSGLVGCGWAIVFARAGFDVALYDYAEDGVAKAKATIGERLRDLALAGLIGSADEVGQHITSVGSLGVAVEGATYVQLSSSDRLMGILRAIVRPANGLVPIADAKFPERRSIGRKTVGYDFFGAAVPLRRFS